MLQRQGRARPYSLRWESIMLRITRMQSLNVQLQLRCMPRCMRGVLGGAAMYDRCILMLLSLCLPVDVSP